MASDKAFMLLVALVVKVDKIVNVLLVVVVLPFVVIGKPRVCIDTPHPIAVVVVTFHVLATR